MTIYIKNYIYWIHRLSDINILSEGYVGVSNNPKRRFTQHKISKQNPHLRYALNKYDDFIIDTIFEGSLEDCLSFELQLRPQEKIGLNLTIGGGKFPTHKGKSHPFYGKHHSDEAIQKMSIKRKGKSPSNKGQPCKQETKIKISITKKLNLNPYKNKPRSNETKLKISEKRSRIYEITFPSGEKKIIKNLSKFCKEYKLHESHIRTKNGTKGFHIMKLE